MNKRAYVFVFIVVIVLVAAGIYSAKRDGDSEADGGNPVTAKVVLTGGQLTAADVNKDFRGTCITSGAKVTYKFESPEATITLTSTERGNGTGRVAGFTIKTPRLEVQSPDVTTTPYFKGQWQVNPGCELARVVGSVKKNQSEDAQEMGTVSVTVGKLTG